MFSVANAFSPSLYFKPSCHAWKLGIPFSATNLDTCSAK
ncbi:Uncharacterised protein [Vibrio cholerae]|nr:Uncharacterised protein [Vibrio cholerae]